MSTVNDTRVTEPVEVPPALLAQWLREASAVLIDVREDFEHAQERIPGAENCPLSRFEPELLRKKYGDRRIVFHCRSGRRSRDAAERFRRGSEPVFHLSGGILAWAESGLPVARATSGPRIDVMRQTQLAIGSVVLVGTLLGLLASPWFLILPAFMGAGLIFAGASGTCGLAVLLARMPWNRAGTACPIAPAARRLT